MRRLSRGCALAIALALPLAVPQRLAAQASRAPVSADQQATVYVSASYMRRTATMEAPVVGTLTKGTVVTVLERVGDWALVESARLKGWVRASTLTFPANAAASQPAKPAPLPAAPAPAPKAEAPAAQPAPTAPVSAPAPAKREDNAAYRGFSLGLLGSVQRVDATPATKAQTHPAGLVLVMLNATRIGLYAAPEYGTGAGYTSTMLGGGIGLPLLSISRLHLMAMVGATTYQESRTAGDATDTWDMLAASGGGLVSIRIKGRMRLAYRGQYVKGLGDGKDAHFLRHAVGLIF